MPKAKKTTKKTTKKNKEDVAEKEVNKAEDNTEAATPIDTLKGAGATGFSKPLDIADRRARSRVKVADDVEERTARRNARRGITADTRTDEEKEFQSKVESLTHYYY